MYIPSGYYRKKALAALKGHWQPALLVALIVNMPTLLMQGVSAFTKMTCFPGWSPSSWPPPATAACRRKR